MVNPNVDLIAVDLNDDCGRWMRVLETSFGCTAKQTEASKRKSCFSLDRCSGMASQPTIEHVGHNILLPDSADGLEAGLHFASHLSYPSHLRSTAEKHGSKLP